ncbi:putative protein K02A2.6 [Larimichthys crocea]|uniref:Integrase catalytic domain-containing protein n=1 Tax=Larimichthys crocea TaxID=215358 RepID=A0A6G0HP25_LARCR|nr:putative protein K02A2.6 [Larimichthys crocea]
MQEEMLNKLHEGHQGITKCVATCAREAHNAAEPLLTTQLPDRPWQRVAADLFQWDNAMYPVVVDYYIEVANLTSTTTAHVTGKLKSIFSRHGVPETVVTDNGPQVSAVEFTTSSPCYAQSNGEAERAMRTVKSLLKKGEDPHKALMAYRATSLSHGSSPAQLLMGRNIRTPLPVSQKKRQPGWPDLRAFQRKDQDLKEKQASWFNKRDNTKTRQELRPGQKVWVKNTKETGTVSGPAETPRSYNIDLPSGSLRRNRSHIRVIPETPSKSRPHRTIRPPKRLDL